MDNSRVDWCQPDGKTWSPESFSPLSLSLRCDTRLRFPIFSFFFPPTRFPLRVACVQERAHVCGRFASAHDVIDQADLWRCKNPRKRQRTQEECRCCRWHILDRQSTTIIHHASPCVAVVVVVGSGSDWYIQRVCSKHYSSRSIVVVANRPCVSTSIMVQYSEQW